MRIIRKKRDRMSFSRGLVNCSSWSACPVCSDRIAGERGRQVMEAIESNRAAGGDELLATFTLRHHNADSLQWLYEGLSEAFRFVRTGRWWAGGKRKRSGASSIGWKDRINYRGTIRGTDCTHGKRNGWHVHLHVIFLASSSIDDDTLAQFEAALQERFANRIAQKLGEQWRPENAIGVKVIRARRAGQYVAKMGLARETTGWNTKRSRAPWRTHRTPMQILAAYGKRRRGLDRELWQEWTGAMHGKHHLDWSPGLKDELLKCDYLSEEKLLEQRAADEENIITIAGAEWDAISDVRWTTDRGELVYARCALHEAAERGAAPAAELLAWLLERSSGASREYIELQSRENFVQLKIRQAQAVNDSRWDRIIAAALDREQGASVTQWTHEPSGLSYPRGQEGIVHDEKWLVLEQHRIITKLDKFKAEKREDAANARRRSNRRGKSGNKRRARRIA